MTDQTKPPGYINDALRIAAQLPKGSIGMLEVRHERKCDLLAGRGQCNCTPQVKLVTPH